MGTKSKVAQANSSQESDDGTGAIGGCARRQVWGRSAGGAVRRKGAQRQAALRGRKDEEGRGSEVQQEESDSSHGRRGLSKVLLSESPGGVEEVTSLGDGRKSDGGWLQEQDMDQRTQVLTTK